MVDTVWSRAADAIRERGWCQGAWSSDEGQVCLEGALELGLGGNNSYRTKYHGSSEGHKARHRFNDFVGGVIQRSENGGLPILFSWNDHPDRTEQEVLEVLDQLHEKELVERGEML